MIVKENVNQNSLSHYKINTAIFQIILKIKQKDYSNMDGNHIRNLKNDFNELLSLNISYESIRKYIFFGDSLYWCDEESELSGYFGYDAQWIRIEGKWWL